MMVASGTWYCIAGFKSLFRNSLTMIIVSLKICIKVMDLIFSTQNAYLESTVNIWLIVVLCKLAVVVVRLTVPPIPSKGDLSWLVVKNAHSASKPKSSE